MEQKLSQENLLKTNSCFSLTKQVIGRKIIMKITAILIQECEIHFHISSHVIHFFKDGLVSLCWIEFH